MTMAQQRMAETIIQFYDEKSNLVSLGIKYKEAADLLDEKVRASMDDDYRNTVLEPLAKFSGYFPLVNEIIKKRQKKLLDFDSQRSKVKKLIEKPSDDPTKLPIAEKQAAEIKKIYQKLNSQLIEDMPKLIDLRVPYLNPSFDAIIKCQLKFSLEAHNQLSGLEKEFADKHLESVESVLQKLRDLSIVHFCPEEK
jgi:hypothetical protein